jgi:hypothetical protein
MLINFISIIFVIFSGFFIDSIFAHYFPETVVKVYFDVFILISLLSTFTRFGLNDNICFSKSTDKEVVIDRFTLIILLILITTASILLTLRFDFLIAVAALLWIISLNIAQVYQDFYKTIPKYILANLSTVLNRIFTITAVGYFVLIEDYLSEQLIYSVALFHVATCIILTIYHNLFSYSLGIKFGYWEKPIFMINLQYGVNNIIQALQPQFILLIIIITNPVNTVEIMFAFKFVAIGGVLNLFIERSYVGMHRKHGTRAFSHFILGVSIFYVLLFIFMHLFSWEVLQFIYADYADDMLAYVYLFLVYACVTSYIVLFTYHLNIHIGVQSIYLVNLSNTVILLIFLLLMKDWPIMKIVAGLILIRLFVVIVYARLMRSGLEQN